MNLLLKLMALNKSAERRFEIKATGEGEVTIYLYDMIVADDITAEWWGGVSAQSFIKELNAITAPVIHLRINSPGGDVFAARVMEQAIREHASKVIAHIDGYAASAASYLALACDEVIMAKGGFFMIHKAWTIAAGNENDFISTASLLGKIDESLVTTYADETGQAPEQLRTWMAAETWFNADESVEYGFADRIAEAAPKASAQWDFSAYANAPAASKTTKLEMTISLKDDVLSDPAFMDKLRAELGIEKPVIVPPVDNPSLDTTQNSDERSRRLRLIEATA